MFLDIRKCLTYRFRIIAIINDSSRDYFYSNKYETVYEQYNKMKDMKENIYSVLVIQEHGETEDFIITVNYWKNPKDYREYEL